MKPMKRRNWSETEQNVVINVYFRMLKMQQDGTPFNKAALARETLPLLDNRTKGSYEAKLMNISGVLHSMDCQWVKGYAPLGHGQGSLKALVMAHPDFTCYK
jgi:hypothetical protein